MDNQKIVGFTCCHNEFSTGHLERCLRHMAHFCDEIIFLDRSSTDDSIQVARHYANIIISGIENDLRKELLHKQMILDEARKIGADWLVWLDCDETFDRRAETGLVRELVSSAEEQNIGAYSCRLYNLYKSINNFRIDDSWHILNQPRLWKISPKLRFSPVLQLHQDQYPTGLENIQNCDLRLIHFGFMSDALIERKYQYYKSIGQIGTELERIKDETGMKLQPFPKALLPQFVG